MFNKSILLIVALATYFSGVSGHGYLSSPAPRCKTIPGHVLVYDCQSDGAFGGNCRDNGRTGPIQATYIQGSEISVVLTMTAPHNGAWQLRFCNDPNGDNSCFSKNLAIPLNNLNSKLPNGANGVSGTYRWLLPANIVGNHVAMQFWSQNDNGVKENFKSCHDITVLPSDGSPPPIYTSTYEPPTSTTSSTSSTETLPSGDNCVCKGVPALGTSDEWCNPGEAWDMCASFPDHCLRVCSAPSTTSIPTSTSVTSSSITSSTTSSTLTVTVTSTVVPTSTVTHTSTVTETCTSSDASKCPCYPIPGTGANQGYCDQPGYCDNVHIIGVYCQRIC